eukprot:scaffold980_cov255-Prasinococcus_capsulatus_cf.AAC.3
MSGRSSVARNWPCASTTASGGPRATDTQCLLPGRASPACAVRERRRRSASAQARPRSRSPHGAAQHSSSAGPISGRGRRRRPGGC